ncbi:maker556 [Drosophila busckii]|uniref:Maker556 n=1 Tax=Drosophila busckii TaxID=30019 RepID=A0A0M4EGL1_DROBS|nr:maker556 [Drosophila busckii]
MPIKAALIDLSGTLHVEDEPTPNAIRALQKYLRESGIAVKFVTNTTKESKSTLHNRLTKIGFNLNIEEIYSSLSAAVAFVNAEKLNPFYLLTDDARQDFPAEDKSRPLDSVVVGLAPNAYDYEHMNKAFNALPATLTAAECVMIGDDANDDIAGAMNVGMHGVLVKTGKFLPAALSAMTTPPTVVLDNFAEAVEWILCKKPC